ncbi:hypothetical protein BGZ49_010860, partial [Haplosporangium sp. Z 27]
AYLNHDQGLVNLKEELIDITRSSYTMELVLNLTEPLVVTLSDGEEVHVLGLRNGLKRLCEVNAVSIRKVKQRTATDIQDESLQEALGRHPFGELVRDDLAKYSLIQQDIYNLNFSQNERDIAGRLIQSGPEVLLALKVEVYGRTAGEDLHNQAIARPDWTDYKFKSVMHGGANKLIIGA